jgi:hypothetical protein
MATSEIEKLERRYAENPHGLTFAPLAEVHRKNGDIARALELLTAGLELHPNYIPASIVLGRCHQDLGDLPSAEAAFAHVLRLDDENVIALKSLGDINERLEHFGEAENWLRRLVSVDRSNDEAREQLQRVQAKAAGVREKAEAAPEPGGASTFEVIDLGPEPAAESPESAAAGAEPETAAPDLLPVDIAALELGQGPAATARHSDEATEPAGASEPPAPVAAAGPVESPEPDRPALEPDEPGPTGETVPAVSGLITAEFQPPLEAIGGIGVETSEEVVLEVSGNSEFRVPDASEDFKSLAERLSAHYRPATTRSPDSESQVPEEAPSTTAKQEPATSEAAEEVAIGSPTARRSYLASETKGRSVAAFFHTLLAARPPADAGSAGAGRTSAVDGDARPPHDTGSLESLTGDDNLPVPPAVPAGEQKADGAVSFDDFFGSEAEAPTPLRQRADPGKDDLDQFQTWLQNLKR